MARTYRRKKEQWDFHKWHCDERKVFLDKKGNTYNAIIIFPHGSDDYKKAKVIYHREGQEHVYDHVRPNYEKTLRQSSKIAIHRLFKGEIEELVVPLYMHNAI